MRKFKSMEQAQLFLNAHAAVHNLFNLGRHLVSAKNYRYFRLRAFCVFGKGSGDIEGA
jgi:putative transposase